MGFIRKFAFLSLRVWILLVGPRLFAIPKPPRYSTRGMDWCVWSFLADPSGQLWAIFILEMLARAKTKGVRAQNWLENLIDDSYRLCFLVSLWKPKP